MLYTGMLQRCRSRICAVACVRAVQQPRVHRCNFESGGFDVDAEEDKERLMDGIST